jgi:hypothetical protein
MKNLCPFFGELIGTFILVFFGCGAVAVTILFTSHVGLFQVAAIWGFAVILAIYVTRHLSCAHINRHFRMREADSSLYTYWDHSLAVHARHYFLIGCFNRLWRIENKQVNQNVNEETKWTNKLNWQTTKFMTV